MADRFPKDADGEALRRIARDGSDLSKPMFINFHVAVPDKPSAKKLAAIAQKLGYRIKVFASPECVLRWTCECSTRMVAAYESVIAVQNELADLSEPFGGRPDGWSTFGNGPIGSPPVR
jgi:regulator of RNase E activity RraB